MSTKTDEAKDSQLYPDPVSRQILQHLSLGLLFVNSRGTVAKACGQFAEYVFGRPCQQMIGCIIDDLLSLQKAKFANENLTILLKKIETTAAHLKSEGKKQRTDCSEFLIKLEDPVQTKEEPFWIKLTVLPHFNSDSETPVMLMIEDQSDLINATESASRKTKDQDQLIQKVLVLHRMNSAQIEVFFLNFKGLMESVELNLVKEKPFHFYRTIHAIAGIAQSANLKKLKNIAIQLEQILLSESEKAWGSEKFKSLVEMLKSEYRSLSGLQKVMSKNIDKISIDFESLAREQMIKNQEIARNQLSSYFAKFKNEKDLEKQKDILNLFQEKIDSIQDSLAKIPVEILEPGIRFRIKSLTENMDKVIDIQFRWDSICISRSISYPLCEVLLHLVTNSIIHGIESPKGRILAKKPGHGTITISLTEHQDTYRISVEDDGTGIDPEQIRFKAKDLHLFPTTSLEKMTPGQLYQLLCKPDINLSPDTGNGSETGSGLELAQDIVRKMGGSLLAISSNPGQNCMISFKILKNFGS